MLSFLPILMSAALVAPAGPLSKSALLTSPTRHVRSADKYIQQLLRTGVAHSPTFVALLARLEQTDVIVHVEPVRNLPMRMAGRLIVLPMGATQRYLRIQVSMDPTPDDIIALIGHELRHAIEVAEAPEVHDEAGLARLYERIGDARRDSLEHLYDTRAARAAGDRVRQELHA